MQVFCFVFIIFMLFGFSVCSGLFILTPVSDREHKLRYLYNFVGLKPAAYYIGNLFADLLLFLMATAMFIALLFPLGLEFLYRGWAQILMILACFGFALITLTYLASFVFKQSIYAFNKIGMWYMIIGLALPMVLTIIVAIAFIRSEQGINTWMYILLVDPFWPLADGLLYVV